LDLIYPLVNSDNTTWCVFPMVVVLVRLSLIVYFSFQKLYKDLIKTPHCEKSDVLYLVKTARTNFGLRQLLRSNQQELSKSAIHNDKNGIIKTQMLFLIGFDSKETKKEKKIIENEIHDFGDFIIGDYFDAYHNLTKKVSSYNYNRKKNIF